MCVCVHVLVNEKLYVHVSMREDSFISGREYESVCFCICVSTCVYGLVLCAWILYMHVWLCGCSCVVGESRSVSSPVITVILLEPRPLGSFYSKTCYLTSIGSPLEGRDLVFECLTDFLPFPVLFFPLPNSVDGNTTASPQLPSLKFLSFFFRKPKLSFLFWSFSHSCLYPRPQHTALRDSSHRLLTELPPPGSSFSWTHLLACLQRAFSKASLWDTSLFINLQWLPITFNTVPNTYVGIQSANCHPSLGTYYLSFSKFSVLQPWEAATVSDSRDMKKAVNVATVYSLSSGTGPC